MGSMLDGMTSFSARLICGRNLPELCAAVNYTRPGQYLEFSRYIFLLYTLLVTFSERDDNT